MSPAFFRIGSAIMIGAGLYHVLALASPAFARLWYPPTYPVWRHVAFIGITSMFAWLFLRRSTWLIWLFALLTVQIYNGHGRQALLRWTTERHIAWFDVVTVVGASVLLMLLAVDRWASTSPARRD